jgi:hypothetical protein
MNRKNTQTYQMLTHVVDFGTRNVSLFPEDTGAKKLLETLKTGAETLSQQAGIWMASKTALRNGRTAKEASRESLKNYLERAAQLSRALHSDRLQLPANPTDQNLIDSGKGFLLEAESMKKEFVEHGLSATFAADLEIAVRTFEKSIQDVRDATGRRSGSLRKWDETLGQTLDALGRFDILVSNALGNDAAALASYAIARAVRRVGGRKAEGTTPTAEPIPATSDPIPVTTTAITPVAA